MIILATTSKNGSPIHGECVMLNRYGEAFECIDNAYHPNPGTEADGYSEIERTIDWLYANNIKAIKPMLDKWIQCRVAYEMDGDPNAPFDDIVMNVMYSDLYDPCDETLKAISKAYKNPKTEWLDFDEVEISGQIALYLNENFLRVRAGGKLNPEGADAIYFRISSHGYDWHNVITDFLWDTFGEPSKMPKRICVCHDAETNPPEVILFDGTPQELFEKFDDKVFASKQNNITIWE